MFYLKITPIILLLSIANNIGNAAVISLNNNINITWLYGNEETIFNISAVLSSSINPANAWLAVGFNGKQLMDGTSIVLCKTSSNGGTIQSWYNVEYVPGLIDSKNPGLGLTNTNIQTVAGIFYCSFRRKNVLENPKYYNINNNTTPYIIYAFGSGDIGYHFTNRGFTENPLNFTSTNNSSSNNNTSNNSTFEFIKKILARIIAFFKSIFRL